MQEFSKRISDKYRVYFPNILDDIDGETFNFFSFHFYFVIDVFRVE